MANKLARKISNIQKEFYMQTQQLGASLQGRLRNTDLPVSKCLYPLFEAVVNAIYAIDDRVNSDNAFALSEGQPIVICLEEKPRFLLSRLKIMALVSTMKTMIRSVSWIQCIMHQKVVKVLADYCG